MQRYNGAEQDDEGAFVYKDKEFAITKAELESSLSDCREALQTEVKRSAAAEERCRELEADREVLIAEKAQKQLVINDCKRNLHELEAALAEKGREIASLIDTDNATLRAELLVHRQ